MWRRERHQTRVGAIPSNNRSLATVALELSVVAGIFVVGLTELLSTQQALRRGPLLIAWIVVGILALTIVFRHRQRIHRVFVRPEVSRWELILVGSLGFIALVVGITAVVAPPNNWDSMVYHLARVAHWAQAGTIEHFPTSISRQNYMPPFAEYVAAHVYILTGTDRFLNLIQWAAWVGSGFAASLLARRLGAGRSGQLAAFALVITLPIGILQGSSTQNDIVVAWWLIVAATIVADDHDETPYRGALLIGGALGLAILTKGSGPILGLPIGIWYAARQIRQRGWWSASRLVVIAVAIAMAVVTPLLVRNLGTYGNPLGPESHEATTEAWGANTFASNLMRNASMHIAVPFTSVDASVLRDSVEAGHRLLGLETSDRRTTFGLPWRPPDRWRRHEDYAANTLHASALGLALASAFLVRRFRRVRPLGVVIVSGALLFCAVLKWQLWHSRLHIPLFVLGAVLVALVGERLLSSRTIAVAGLALVVAGLPYAFANETRPLIGFDEGVNPPRFRESVITADRSKVYFYARRTVEDAYRFGIPQIGACEDIGLKLGFGAYEYPIWVLRPMSDGRSTLRHVDVQDRSRRIADSRAAPCAVVASPGNGQPSIVVNDEEFISVWEARNKNIPVFQVYCPSLSLTDGSRQDRTGDSDAVAYCS